MHLWLSLLMTTLTNLNVPMVFSWMGFQGLWFKQKRYNYRTSEGAAARIVSLESGMDTENSQQSTGKLASYLTAIIYWLKNSESTFLWL